MTPEPVTPEDIAATAQQKAQLADEIEKFDPAEAARLKKEAAIVDQLAKTEAELEKIKTPREKEEAQKPA